MSEKYVYQYSDHMPPWALVYDIEYLKRGIKAYVTLFSEQIGNTRNAVVFDVLAYTPFSVAHQIQSHCTDHGVTFDETDFNQIEWEFSKYF